MNKRKDGRFEKAIKLPNGRLKHIYANSKTELESKVLAIQMQAKQGVAIDDKTSL